MNSQILKSKDEYCWQIPPEQTIHEYVLRRVAENVAKGRNECLINCITGETIKYKDIERLSKNAASGLFKLGFRKGDVVINSSHNAAQLHAFMLGVWRANGVVRASYPEDFGDTLAERIRESNCKWITCDPQFVERNLETIDQIGWEIKLIVFGDVSTSPRCISVSTLFGDDGNACPNPEVGPADAALVLATSGTTGSSKGAWFNHRAVVENILAYEYLPFTDDGEEASIVTSKQTHFIGCLVPFSYFCAGRKLVMMNEVTIERIMEAVEKYKVRAIFGFFKFLLALANDPLGQKYDLSSLCYLSTAGQLVVPETMKTILTFPNLKSFMIVYGMSECGVLASSADWTALSQGVFKAYDDHKAFSVGKLPPRTSLKVLDEESGEILGPNQKGELCILSPLTCQGYLNKPEATAETFQNGWLKSGDVGYFDDDGYIYIVDRSKEIFKCFNNHVSPSEIENILLKHPSVAEAICCGIPDSVGADTFPRAFVVLKENVEKNANTLKEFLNNQVASYKQLRGGLFIIPLIPVGKTGKVSRKQMSEFPTKV